MMTSVPPTVSYGGRRAETQRKSQNTINGGSGLKEQGGPETRRSLEDITVIQIPSFDKYLLITYFVRTAEVGKGKKH